MINPNKKLKNMTKKLDDILDWLVDSPMDNKDYNDIHKIFNKYLEIEENQQASEQKG
jgi:predicted ATPase